MKEGEYMFRTKKEKYAYVKGIKAGNKGSYTPVRSDLPPMRHIKQRYKKSKKKANHV